MGIDTIRRHIWMTAGGTEHPTTADVLVRSTDNRMIAGVAGGLAEWTGRDVRWFRIGFVVGAYALGLGLVAYVALLALPSEPGTPRPDARLSSRAVVGAVLAGMATIAVIVALAVGDGASPELVLRMSVPLVVLGAAALVLLIAALRSIDDSEGEMSGRGVVGFGFALLTIALGLTTFIGLVATAEPIF